MADRYPSFARLSAYEKGGIDFRIDVVERASTVTILAPHGGVIEPMTSQLTRAIAGSDFSYYCFEGIRPGRPHGDLHITSERFDEPRGVALVGRSDVVVAVHGRKDGDDPESVWIGGLDVDLIAKLKAALDAAGYRTLVASGRLEGRAQSNICNRGRRGRGAQLELPRTLRDRLRDNRRELDRIATAARSAITDA